MLTREETAQALGIMGGGNGCDLFSVICAARSSVAHARPEDVVDYALDVVRCVNAMTGLEDEVRKIIEEEGV